jgi:hypothetical protein
LCPFWDRQLTRRRTIFSSNDFGPSQAYCESHPQSQSGFHMKRFRPAPFLVALTALGALAPVGKAQPTVDVGSFARTSGSPSPSATHPQLDLTYRRPTERAKIRNHLFDTFGSYPIAGGAILGAVNQADKTPPEWGKGARAYGRRVGSDFSTAMVTTTTCYALAEAFREARLYYRCECGGVFRRPGHAVISTVTARRGDDAHRHLSFPLLIAPYEGTVTAVDGWYPSRYSIKDAPRMCNYDLLALAGGNIARESTYGGPHTRFRRGGALYVSGNGPGSQLEPLSHCYERQH